MTLFLAAQTGRARLGRILFRSSPLFSIRKARRLLSPYRLLSTTKEDASPSFVRLGNAQVPLGQHLPFEEYQIPRGYLPPGHNNNATMLHHLQWMMQKDSLGQDMLLLGMPGAGSIWRRRLALAYAELCHRPVQVVTLTSETTESDLKQRREIVDESVVFVDQPPVKAAKEGHLLILDGVHRAERNVLPTLNNLLENREIHLEDGSFLMSPERHARLMGSTNDDSHRLETNESSSPSWIACHPDFRVIALGVPTPPFAGRTLDPPIRSRFQIRRIDPPSAQDMLQSITQHDNETTLSDELSEWGATFSSAMTSTTTSASITTSLADAAAFPFTSVPRMVQGMAAFPEEPKESFVVRAFPIGMSDSRLQSIVGRSRTADQKAGASHDRERLRSAMSVVGESISDTSTTTAAAASNQHFYQLTSIEESDEKGQGTALVQFQSNRDPSTHQHAKIVPCGEGELGRRNPSFLMTPEVEQALSDMMQEHSLGQDVLLLSPKGEGKNVLAQQFSSLLGYNTHLFSMYSEMTHQDLLLRRSTDAATGETKWDESPLVTAARCGDVCILDGVELLHPDVLASLQSLCADREMHLPDGRRILRQDGEDGSNVLSVHPSFRIIALGSLKPGASVTRWITPDTMSMFSTIMIPELSDSSLRAILESVNPNCPPEVVDTLLRLQQNLTESVADSCGVAQLSTRNQIRIVRRCTNQEELSSILRSVFLTDLLPPGQRDLMEQVWRKSGVSTEITENTTPLSTHIEETKANIGTVSVERKPSNNPELVPSVDFVEIPCHLQTMRDLLRDSQSGERAMLLLGNQGVGKNIIIDRLCEIANWEREYIQLHRDSTIGQLTLSPSLEGGKIVWNDSPLVRAVREGRVLVVDEADKAPVEVISVLKGLVEDGELLLSDGRRISKQNDGPGYIPIHPDFSIWVLANRPGFPFHGNDFFQVIGDCFSTSVIQNPDIESEINLLTSFAPSRSVKEIRAIAESFAELRQLSDQGDINYPYSTREAVAVVKHMQEFPDEDSVTALHNVLDFDSFEESVYLKLGQVFQQHDIAMQSRAAFVAAQHSMEAKKSLRVEYLGSKGEEMTSSSPPQSSMPKTGKWDDANEAHVGGNQWAGGTGGSDTAGLGGRGGPYRLDRGHQVHQVSEEAKARVSDQANEAARKMGREALAQKLKEIDLSEEEWKMYTQFSSSITDDIRTLRNTLNSVIVKTKERGWLRKQRYGELDETRLIDSVTGDAHVYKRRSTTQEENPAARSTKRIQFVMDCSGSMYRFNGYDQRLVRCLEAALLVMEAFHGFEDKFDYSITGHSGDSPNIPIVDFGRHPQTEKQRMQILQSMIAHSQYCRSGDYTLEAIQGAIEDVAGAFADETTTDDCIVIGVSDANLARYGIHPKELGKIIQDGDTAHGVRSFCIFIASLGEEAQEIQQSLPLGRGHTCLDTSDLPKVVRDILTSSVVDDR